MKKSLLLSLCLVCIALATRAQNKELPPAPTPPAPPEVEMEKFTPPTIVQDKEVNIALPATPLPPPVPQKLKYDKKIAPKGKMIEFTPSNILQNEKVNVAPPPPPPLRHHLPRINLKEELKVYCISYKKQEVKKMFTRRLVIGEPVRKTGQCSGKIKNLNAVQVNE